MKKFIIALVIVVGIGLVLGAGARVVLGNPTAFLVGTQTATATSTIAYLTAGTATTTITCDSYAPNCALPSATGAAGRPLANDRVALLLRMYSSSTPTTLKINVEYSQDGIDWYEDGGTTQNNYATTTKPFDISQVPQYTLNFASSTPGQGAVPAGVGNATTTKIVLMNSPTRFIRAVFTDPAGSGTIGLWAQLVPSRQQQ